MPVIICKVDLCPPARTFLMTAELIKLNYESRSVNCIAGETANPDFVDKNPQHTIPLLEDGDVIIADSHAISTYIVSKYGGDKQEELYSSDLGLRATIDHRLYLDATVLFSPCRAVLKGIIYEQLKEPSEKHIIDADEAYSVLEGYLKKSKFVACDHLTLADVACAATISSMELLVPIDDKFIKVNDWMNRLKNEEWYQKANVPGLNQLAEQLQMMVEKNKGQNVITAA